MEKIQELFDLQKLYDTLLMVVLLIYYDPESVYLSFVAQVVN